MSSTRTRTLFIGAPRGSGGGYAHLSRVVPRVIGLLPSWRIEVHAPRSVLRACFGTDRESWMHPYEGEGHLARLRWEFVDLPRLLAGNSRALAWAPFGPPLNVAIASRTVWMSRNILPLVPARQRELSPRDQPRVAFLRRVYTTWARRARRTICVSLHARELLARLARVAPETIAVIPHGVDAPRTGARCASEELEALRVRPYVLHVGQPIAYRRTRELFEGYARLTASRPDVPPLVAVGKARTVDHAYEEDCLRRLSSLIRVGRARVFGQVAHPDVLALMGSAHTFAYPSVQEDCPNVVLEALSAGRVGVYANIAAVRELAGDAGVLVDDPSGRPLEAALERAVFDGTLRQTIAAAATARASAFTWDRCAEHSARVLEEAAD